MSANAKGRHAGGAWKVAYADFVTAMMALFMVLWISSENPKVRLEAAWYFRHPTGLVGVEQPHDGVMSGSHDVMGTQGEGRGSGAGGSTSAEPVQLAYLNSVADRFRRLLEVDDTADEQPIQVSVTSDGVQVTLFDRGRLPLFVGNTCSFTPRGQFVLQSLAWLIERYGERVAIEGFTRSGLTFRRPNYGPWELSIDRANAARRLLLASAVHPPIIDRVVGYGARDPLPGMPPQSAANQRIVITVVPSMSATSSS